ncbi:EthD domain-containing protein [Sphingobium sp. HBC34]|uniref:EthD domain-containing protein n=1 Tax=Sphingobium cyanobacteriorum TaxID=3063954 RepID=A0ABT8ZPF0_9SPHN|nr:EthD domain-containing protein [Sphingobium sp. HBC34]MDO7836412.1 EthD domain-containing protein [Sphingobium sp. HBC34]
MIKILFCLRRLPGLSQEEFQAYWYDKHAPLVREHAAALGIRRYVQSHSFAHPQLQPALDARRGEVAPYDGVAQLWYDNVDAMLALNDKPEARRAGKALLEDERRFIDLPNSPLFYAVEREIIPLAI